MCGLGAAHMDIERGRGDNPDERVTLSTSRASTAGAQRASGRGENTAWEALGVQVTAGCADYFQNSDFFQERQETTGGFLKRDVAYVSWGRSGYCLLFWRHKGKKSLQGPQERGGADTGLEVAAESRRLRTAGFQGIACGV